MALLTTATRQRRARKAAIPAVMEAAAVDRFGRPAVLTLHELPVPKLGAREVLIELHASGVGTWDASVRDGSWRPYGRPRFPLVPGTDGAGVIVSRGARASRFLRGERVWACDYANPKGGFYAEYVAVDVDHAGRVPRHMGMLEAGAGATTGLTALQGIEDHLKVRAEETVLIFGASGAVGTLAVTFAKYRRAKVLGTASGRSAAALVRRQGADAVIDVRSENAVERLRALAPDGLDAVLALAGGEELERCLDLVRAGGRVAYPNGVEPEPRRRPKVRVLAYDASNGAREFARLERAATEARLRVPIAAVYRLAEAAKAHERLEQGHILGRIVLKIRSKIR